jgi:hypothetical protein
MEYVGWRDVRSAMRYIDGGDPFARQRIEASLPAPTVQSPPALPAPEALPASSLDLRLALLASTPGEGRAGEARRQIEDICLTPHHAQRLDAEGHHYRLAIADEGAVLDEAVATLLDAMRRIADNHQCSLEASLRGADGRHWD